MHVRKKRRPSFAKAIDRSTGCVQGPDIMGTKGHVFGVAVAFLLIPGRHAFELGRYFTILHLCSSSFTKLFAETVCHVTKNMQGLFIYLLCDSHIPEY